MEIDFYKDYKDLPVPELVKVARSPWDYLPEAITAAERVLKDRGVTAEEIAAEEWKLAQKEMSDALAKRRFGDYFNWVKELFPSIEEGPASRPWIYLFLLGFALYYVYRIYSIITSLVFLVRCEVCTQISVALFLLVLDAIYLTAALFFLLKQKPLGWALLFIQAVVLSLIRFSRFYGLYARHVYFPPLVTLYVLPFLAYAGVIIFLWRPFVLEFFRIGPRFKNIAVWIAIVLGIAGMMGS